MDMRLRLILSFALVVLVTIASISIIAGSNTTREVQSFMGRGGIFGIESTVGDLENYYSTHGSWSGVDTAFHLSRDSHGMGMGGRGMRGQGMGPEDQAIHLQLADTDGNVLMDTQDPNSAGRLSQEELSNAIPLEVDNKIVGYLLPGENLPMLKEAGNSLLERLKQTVLTAALIAGGISLVLALLLAHRLLRPVRDLTMASSYLAQGDFSQRVPVYGNDELATLGRTFNHMAESLQQAEESRRALTADIAHELRTPLAVQRAHLEALEDGVYPLTLDNLTTIGEQNRLLTRLVDDLRTLALADAGRLELEITPTDFPALVERVAARFGPQAANRQIEIQLSLSDSCPPLSLDAQRIEQILNNLLSNALRYTPDGGKIECRLVVDEAGEQGGAGERVAIRHSPFAILEIRDIGPGIPENALPRVFERFYRVDKSRSRTEPALRYAEGGGTGLGLSIARKLAQAHGGDLTAANHPEGGALFTLILPINV